MVLSNKEWLDKMDEIIYAIQNASGDSQVIEDMLSNMWNSSITYNVGDYVLYNNKIWKCLVQNSNIIPTEGDTWTSVTITNEISTLNSNLKKQEWVKIGIIYGAGSLSFNPLGYSELLFEFFPNADEINNAETLTFIPSSYDFTNKKWVNLRCCGFLTTNDYTGHSVSLDTTKLSIGNYSHYNQTGNVTQKYKTLVFGKPL